MPTFAAVDIGSNSVRLKIASTSGGKLRTLHEDREVTRLGESVFRSGSFSPPAMEHTIAVLRRFYRAVQHFAVDRVRVVGTSATRDARNARVFCDLVKSATGWKLEVISGLEEGRLIHLGVMSGTRVSADVVLLADLGGGSCELTLSRGGHIDHMVSLPLGAVRLTQEFLQHDPPKRKELKRLRQFVAEEIERVRSRFRAGEIRATIATSGTAAALHGVWTYQHRRGSRTVPAAGLAAITAKLEKLSARERAALRGIGPRRAEIIIAGATVFTELLARLKLASLRYSPLGLRDGLLAQMAADYGRSPELRTRIATERSDAILALCQQYRVDLKHATQVRSIAEKLFASLAAVHRLAPEYREFIAAAAMLHEVGVFINRSGRYRHAYYVIANSDIFGYTPAERRVIAAIARYLGKGRPHPSHPAVRAVAGGERAGVPRAVALLRLAKALDQARRGAIEEVRVRRDGSTVKLLLRARRGAELELWALDKQRDFFREVFGHDLVIAEAPRTK